MGLADQVAWVGTVIKRGMAALLTEFLGKKVIAAGHQSCGAFTIMGCILVKPVIYSQRNFTFLFFLSN